MADSDVQSRQRTSDGLGFPKEIEHSLDQVRLHTAAIIEAVCGESARAKDVSDRFGLHAKLGWQIWNVAYAPALTAVRFLPNSHGMQLWRQSAAERAVPEEWLTRLDNSVANLRRVMDSHAEDREMFEMILDAQVDLPNDEAEIRWRKQAVAGNSFTFGVRAKCVLATAIFFPAEVPHHFSIVRLHGLIDLVQTRVGVRWPFSSLVVQQTDGSETTPGREPLLETPGGSCEVPLLTRYCSHPLPRVERRFHGQTVSDELLPGLVGLQGASTVITGEILHDVGPAHGIEGGEVAHFGSGLRTPADLLICDHIVHRSLFPDAERELRVYSELLSSTTRDDRDRLNVSEALEKLGNGLASVGTPEIPKYQELLAEAFARIGYSADDFDVYRVRMRYPPIPASVMVRHTLPAPP